MPVGGRESKLMCGGVGCDPERIERLSAMLILVLLLANAALPGVACGLAVVSKTDLTFFFF